jgi:hypothetical protein
MFSEFGDCQIGWVGTNFPILLEMNAGLSNEKARKIRLKSSQPLRGKLIISLAAICGLVHGGGNDGYLSVEKIHKPSPSVA